MILLRGVMLLKKMSELMKLSGLSRKALEGYERLGLLKPERDPDNGYRLYDDRAVSLIALIQMLTAIGYDRKGVKRLLEEQDMTLEEIAGHAEEQLATKIRHYQGLLGLARMLKIQWASMQSLPLSVYEKVSQQQAQERPSYPCFRRDG